VTLWWCELVADDAALAELSTWLAPAEHARAARFAAAPLSRRYVVGRAALRWLLARRLGTTPADVPIERGPRGRPQLAGIGEVDFNVSNTRGVALIGFVDRRRARIGLDLEHLDRDVRHEGLARKFLTDRERSEVAGLSDDAQRRAFLRRWTCKEAMSKATGDALAAPLRILDVALGSPPRLVAGPPPYDPSRWTLHDAEVPAGFVATVALWHDGTP
jgi:4'-phosphopantetheinyl transferase